MLANFFPMRSGKLGSAHGKPSNALCRTRVIKRHLRLLAPALPLPFAGKSAGRRFGEDGLVFELRDRTRLLKRLAARSFPKQTSLWWQIYGKFGFCLP